MIEYLVIGFLLAITGVLSYVVRNLLRKIEVYEGWVDMFRDEIKKTYSRLKAVDDKELFIRDEDVGFIFSEIVRVTKEFNDKVQ